MKKSEFLELLSKSSRDDLNEVLHEKCKPVKLITPCSRIKNFKENKKNG